MKYYAVTEDPNEMMHWGIKGMKWGVRHDKPRHSGSGRKRSAAYKKAQSKLGKMMKSGIKKAEASWKNYNSPAEKEKRFMDKAMQKARTGTLKYGKLTDDQVRRVRERLALERDARQLGSTENPRYAKRIKTAIGEGIIRGIGGGTGAYIEERFRGRGKTTAEIKGAKRKEKYENRSSTQSRKARIKQKEEFYKTAYEEGMNPIDRRFYNSNERAKYIAEAKERNKLSEIKKSQRDAFDKAYYANSGKYAAEEMRNRRTSPVGSDWSSAQRTPRLTSGYSISTPQPTTPTHTSQPVYIVASNGAVKVSRRKTGWRK